MMESKKFIDIKKVFASKNAKLLSWIPGFVVRYLQRIVHEDEINAFISSNSDLKNEKFCTAVLDYLHIKTSISGIENIPKTGPAIIVMNHPLGGPDAMAFISALSNYRTDLKFIVNDLLLNLDSMKDMFVGVNKHGKNERTAKSSVIDLFKSEQLVCVFPAGLVSRKEGKVIKDLEWKKTFVTNARKTGHLVVPVHASGQLSPFFYRLANLRKWLGIKLNIEMFYLADELFKQRNKSIHFTVGQPILPADFPAGNDLKVAQQIKELVYKLPSGATK